MLSHSSRVTKQLLVCIYTHSTWGGIETWLAGLTAHLSRNGWEVVIGLARGMRHNDPKPLRKTYSPYRTVEMDGRTGTPEGRIRAVQRIIRRVCPDVVMPLGLADVYPAIGRSRQDGLQVRLAIALHAINCELLHDTSRAEPVIDLCVGVNPLQEKFLLNYGAFEPDRLKTIVNGVPLPDVPHEVNGARKIDEPLQILFVGRLSHQHKRVLDLAPLVQELHRRAVSFRLTVAGSGQSEAELRNRLQSDVLTGHVLFTGYMSPEEIRKKLYPEQHVLIVLSPPLGEACPLVIQEAMAHGVVPICTDFIGIRSLGFIRNGKTGYVYPCGEVFRAADYLKDLANDSTLLLSMSQACREAAREFALDIAHRKWLEALDDLAQRPPRPLLKDLRQIGLEPERGRSRLDRLMSPQWADRVRRALRRWPNHSDGWGEWPGTISEPDEETKAAMIAELRQLDQFAVENPEAVNAEGRLA